MQNEPTHEVQAFPIQDIGTHGCYGMSLRDWFAGQAMIGLLAKSQFGMVNIAPNNIGHYAYQAADSMMKTREHEKVKTND